MAAVRSDKLRRRPNEVRYFYLAVSNEDLHTGASYGGLKYVKDKHGVVAIYLSDVITGQTREVAEPVESFMAKWRQHYNDAAWDYFAEVGG